MLISIGVIVEFSVLTVLFQIVDPLWVEFFGRPASAQEVSCPSRSYSDMT